MESICENLTNTYNTNVLDTDPKIRDEFYKASLTHRESKKGKTILMDLIYNHMHQYRKPIRNFIGGPRTITLHWSEKYKKMIYIFGESYSAYAETDCWKFPSYPGQFTTPIETYLSQLILNTDVFIDVFFEFPVYRGKEYNSTFQPFQKYDRMNKLFLHFKECVQYSTRSAKECSLARIHYFDARYVDYLGIVHGLTTLSEYRNIVMNIINNYKKSEWSDKFKEDSYLSSNIKILEELAEPDDEKFISFLMSQIYQNRSIIKNLNKITEDSSMKEIILEFIKKEFKEQSKDIRSELQKQIRIILNAKYHTSQEFADSLLESMNLISTLIALIADAYTLSRIFKDFNMAEKAYKGANDQPDRAHNIIIYAGEEHSKIYRKFLESVGFEEFGRSGKSENDYTHEPNYCIDMQIGNIKQPLFSEWPPSR